MKSSSNDPSAEAARRASVTDLVADPSQYYIVTATERRDERTRVLKHGDSFAVFDAFGDVGGIGPHEQGIYYAGTRHVSGLEVRLAGRRPLLLSSALQEGSVVLAVDLTNPDIPITEDNLWRKGLLHVFRSKFLWHATCYERLSLSNFGLTGLELSLEIALAADFADIFEVRGTRRARHGQMRPTQTTQDGVRFGYEGLDGVSRHTIVECDPPPTTTSSGRLRFDLRLEPRQAAEITMTITCGHGEEPEKPHASFNSALTDVMSSMIRAKSSAATIRSSSRPFDDWIERSRSDLYIMATETPYGRYPYAGVPWFSTVFGRDGIITALSMLWPDPGLARGVLGYLAATQATREEPARDAQPGKILHESRDGEMPALEEVPFGRYYGSVDSTPLFVLLAGRYYDRTGDLATIRALWPNIEAALRWIDTYGDPDEDGFVEYARSTDAGLIHQGWKDSHDAIFHEDGAPAEGPIALCEVQGYVYAARHHAAELALALGDKRKAKALQRQAEALHVQFERQFWNDEIGAYALALDGQKRQCVVVSSNAGQCLMSGIATPPHAQRVAETLMHPAMFTGWGVRTVRAGESRYNPMSYHNGSVWPHDTALVAAGLARYGFKDHVERLVSALFDASVHLDLFRLPELFCGFERRTGEGPTRYPIACAPQAWASAAVYQLIKSLLGLEIDGVRQRVVFRQPRLPESLEWLRLTNLTIGGAELDLLCERRGQDVGISVLRKVGDVTLATER
jgi:glycogen debranching enzyme